MPRNTGRRGPRCSFCGMPISPETVAHSGPTAFICDDCVRLSFLRLKVRARKEAARPIEGQARKPRDIRAELDRTVIGQEHAKKVLSVAVYNHHKRLAMADDGEVELQKSNVLLVGPTGTGKTLLVQSLARTLDVPIAICDATTLTEAGYVGDDVENVLLRLVQAAGGSVEQAQRGIIYIDEVDKLARKGESASITRDVSGEGVQQTLLRMIEGAVSRVPEAGGRKHPSGKCHEVDTSQILFILGGAFSGLEDIVGERLGRNRAGFGGSAGAEVTMDRSEALRRVEPGDLVRYGIIPELIGRLPVFTSTAELDESDLVEILFRPRNALVKQYKRLLAADGVRLEVSIKAAEAVAAEALRRGTGARGLRAVLEELMLDVMYEVPSRVDITDVVITESVVLGEQRPLYRVRPRTAARGA